MIADFIPELTIAINEIRFAGYPIEAKELEDKTTNAYTASTALLGEIGISIKAILKSIGPYLPKKTQNTLKACSVEISKVWPELHY
jgi:hypothetical protein